jgi:hypothetical protein
VTKAKGEIMQLNEMEINVLRVMDIAGGTLDHGQALKASGSVPCETLEDFQSRIDSLRNLRDAGYISEDVEKLELNLTQKGREVV